MKDILPILVKCALFSQFTEAEVSEILKQSTTRKVWYEKNQLIAIEDEHCSSIGIVLIGKIEIKNIYATGKVVTITTLNQGSIFGEAMVFSNIANYPATIFAAQKTHILFISRDELLDMCSSNSKFLSNLLGLLSNKIFILNGRIKSLSYQTIRQKLISFIIEEQRKNNNTTFRMQYSRKQMAEILGIPRPSLSREMANMKKEGIIEYCKNEFTIIDMEKLESFML